MTEAQREKRRQYMKAYRARNPRPKRSEAELARQRIKSAEWRARHRAAGRCGACGGERDDEFRNCSTCRKRTRASIERLFAKRREQGLCPQCGVVPHTKKAPHSRCDECLWKIKVRAYERDKERERQAGA